MNLDWLKLKAVVIQSDDWGLCAWSPDLEALRVLSDTPVFRTEAGRRYGGSTLESAEDVRQLCGTLLEFRGGDGYPPVWQANTVMAAPDFERLRPPQFVGDSLPLVQPPETPSRWGRPGLWEEIERMRAMGLWWPELHGLHHLPEHAWLQALRRGEADARRAHEQQSPVCQAVQDSGEYDASEPRSLRQRNFRRAVELFQSRFGRLPSSLCPPDYRWDAALEQDAESLGVTILQGFAEQHGHRLARLRRLALHYRWPNQVGSRFFMPPRIAFEPSAIEMDSGGLAARVHDRVRKAWRRGQPAVLSTHRVNYVHLLPERSVAGRAALRDLLERLIEDRAVFLVDSEVRQLQEKSWSLRPVGSRGVLVRYYGVPGETIRFPVTNGAAGVRVREGHGAHGTEARIEAGQVVARLNVGEVLLEWADA